MHYGWIIVLASLVVGVCGYGTFFSFTLFYPHLVSEFGWSRVVISGAMSVGLVTYGLFSLPMGWCADRFGPRVTVVLGGLMFGSGTALGVFISEPWHLYALYGGITAIGVGAVWSPLVSTVSRWFVTRRGLAIGIATLGGGSGVFFIAPLAEVLIVNLGWRDAYLWLGVVTGILIVGSALLLSRDPLAKGMQPYGAIAPQSGSCVSGSSESGRSIGHIARTWLFWRLTATFGLWWFAGIIVYVQIAPYMLEKSLEPTLVAALVTVFGAGSCVGRVVLGVAADRIGPRRAYQLGAGISALMMSLMAVAADPTLLLGIAIVLGFGIGGASTQFTTVSVALFGTSSAGVLMGAVLALMCLIGACGPLVSGLIHDLSASYTPAFYLGAGAFAISLLLAGTLHHPER
jgi:MFS family permease